MTWLFFSFFVFLGAMVPICTQATTILQQTEGASFFSLKSLERYFSYPCIAIALGCIPARLSPNMSGSEKAALFLFLFPLGLGIAVFINAILRLIFQKRVLLIIAQALISIFVLAWALGLQRPTPSYSGSSGSSSGGYHSSSNHKCYVCGEDGNILYGSHYYCSTHYAYVKTIVDNS